MIYEFQTLTLRAGKMKEYEQRFGELLDRRERYSPLAACWRTEIGPLNEVVQIWPYEDDAHRAEVRAALAADPDWPLPLQGILRRRRVEIMLPAEFMRPLEPGRYGDVYEMRSYTWEYDSVPAILERWAPWLPGREALSPMLGCWYTDAGGPSNWVHIWPYDSVDHRTRMRARAVAEGLWPPGPVEEMMEQDSKILVPLEFSPIR